MIKKLILSKIFILSLSLSQAPVSAGNEALADVAQELVQQTANSVAKNIGQEATQQAVGLVAEQSSPALQAAAIFVGGILALTLFSVVKAKSNYDRQSSQLDRISAACVRISTGIQEIHNQRNQQSLYTN